ncbi:hypothetical protein N9164_15340 [Draconibacterium sp.]|nr:hypothetical protein [Draconibacterium sp.]
MGALFCLGFDEISGIKAESGDRPRLPIENETNTMIRYYERLFLAYSVEKLEFFPGGKIIFDMRNYKI